MSAVELQATLGTNPRRTRRRGFLGISPGYPELAPVTVDPVRGIVEAGQLTAEAMGATVERAGLLLHRRGRRASPPTWPTAAPGRVTPPRAAAAQAAAALPNEGDENRLVSIYGVARIGADASEDG